MTVSPLERKNAAHDQGPERVPAEAGYSGDVLALSGRRRRERGRNFGFKLVAKGDPHASLLCVTGGARLCWKGAGKERAGRRRWHVSFVGGSGQRLCGGQVGVACDDFGRHWDVTREVSAEAWSADRGRTIDENAAGRRQVEVTLTLVEPRQPPGQAADDVAIYESGRGSRAAWC
eukprot:6214389-Pleurochrysis_carterae.AAC.2